MSLVDRHGLWNAAQVEAAIEVERQIRAEELEVVRLSFADQHGILRGKSVIGADAVGVMRDGCAVTSTLLAKDTAHRTVFPVFTAGGGFGMREMEGAADVVMVADPTTFRVLPWAPKTGWVLCDLYFADGRPVPFSTRHLYRSVLDRLTAAGYDFMAGLEVEFHVFKLLDPRLRPTDSGQPGEPPEVALLTQGYQYLTELRYDQFDPVFDILRRDVMALGLKLRSIELEYGPSQCEFTFHPGIGLEPADTMVLLRNAVKQIARRHGYHASFMCRPRIPNVMSSGWHLHQSLRDRQSGANAFVSHDERSDLSPTARHWLGGLLAHARAAAAFATPTLNGYKRFRPYSLAPDRAIWGRDNRGVMVRTLGMAGDPATRLENRVGEPAANPYLYMASQVLAGLDGLKRKLDPGPSADTPYEADAELLPKSLGEAVAALRADACFREGLGAGFIDYYARIKEAEVARFQAEVTEWEQREYFELF
ncbi:glutamine synthetase family protein [Reyranella sp. CPCC 100927]|uniref:glutamine synthetase family protein n=1 Tax=Reyranella sp. CPCC 100927 TaxID=2599616 RepID=UPI0011B76E12|nr:glutamine synthetase [Reyranella sp. CPCC 100927]TWT06023.1 glutamine synthetase [Reyranella sp. CPCC 100927]